MEAIILAGGLGTRLKPVIEEVPKSMALVNAKPFLEYQLDQLIANGIHKFIFSVGYKHESIRHHFSDNYKNCEIVYAVEETLLGTGGAIKNAMKYVTENHVVVVNGDTLFMINIRSQYKIHLERNADITLALKPMNNIERYGTIQLDDTGRITQFSEKKAIEKGLINGGLYIFNVQSFNSLNLPVKFSIEKEVFEKMVKELNLSGFISSGYFLDIGLPEDYQRAQLEISVFPMIDKSWTLFLDRDGVINKKLENDYVASIQEFKFLPDVLEALAMLSNFFGKIIIVTNQQGVGKGLMSEEDLRDIHQYLLDKIGQYGARIDAIYYAPQLAEEASIMRKPQIGMALEAKKEFPEIDFTKSVMVGDSLSDIEFGKRAKMITILISEAKIAESHYSKASLVEFSELLASILNK